MIKNKSSTGNVKNIFRAAFLFMAIAVVAGYASHPYIVFWRLKTGQAINRLFTCFGLQTFVHLSVG
ncbi:MAG: hypothetical protein MRJ65_17650 [Candidatus Brocadiaceae bacterium]|nr:hypothetical protein [Candidatus Brocadiaceae bacterium]